MGATSDVSQSFLQAIRDGRFREAGLEWILNGSSEFRSPTSAYGLLSPGRRLRNR
jgi:hypothetical protein